MSTTNEEKKLLVRSIFDKLISYYGLENIDGLAKWLNVKYSTLKGWERRGKIADIEPFLFKCQNISPYFLKTGEEPMFESTNEIGGRLKELRGDKTVEEVCSDLEFLPEDWVKWEQNLVCPGADNIAKIAEYFEANAAWLATGNLSKRIPEFSQNTKGAFTQSKSPTIDPIRTALDAELDKLTRAQLADVLGYVVSKSEASQEKVTG
jgi:hypothetical protein